MRSLTLKTLGQDQKILQSSTVSGLRRFSWSAQTSSPKRSMPPRAAGYFCWKWRSGKNDWKWRILANFFFGIAWQLAFLFVAQDLVAYWKTQSNSRWFKNHPVLSDTDLQPRFMCIKYTVDQVPKFCLSPGSSNRLVEMYPHAAIRRWGWSSTTLRWFTDQVSPHLWARVHRSGKQKFEILTVQFPRCPSSSTLDNRILFLGHVSSVAGFMNAIVSPGWLSSTSITPKSKRDRWFYKYWHGHSMPWAPRIPSANHVSFRKRFLGFVNYV